MNIGCVKKIFSSTVLQDKMYNKKYIQFKELKKIISNILYNFAFSYTFDLIIYLTVLFFNTQPFTKFYNTRDIFVN